MTTKRLFRVKNSITGVTVDQDFSSKTEAKKLRDSLNENKKEYIVVLGPDHWRYNKRAL